MGTGGIVGTIIGVIAFLIIFFLIIYFVYKRQNKYKTKTKKHKSIPGYYWSSVQNKYVPLNEKEETQTEVEDKQPLNPMLVVTDVMECGVSAEDAKRLVSKYSVFIQACIDKYGLTFLKISNGHFDNPLNAFIYGYQKYNGNIDLLLSEENETLSLIFDLAVEHDTISIDELQFYEDKKNTLYLVVNPNFADKCRPDTITKNLYAYIDAWHYLKDPNINENCKNPFIKYLVSDASLDFDLSTSNDIDVDFSNFTSKVDLTKSTESNRLIKGIIYSSELRRSVLIMEKKWNDTTKENRREALTDFIEIKSDFISKVDKIDCIKDSIVTNDDIQSSLKRFALIDESPSLSPVE